LQKRRLKRITTNKKNNKQYRRKRKHKHNKHKERQKPRKMKKKKEKRMPDKQRDAWRTRRGPKSENLGVAKLTSAKALNSNSLYHFKSVMLVDHNDMPHAAVSDFQVSMGFCYKVGNPPTVD
jgi:hypothetical protein